jgi:hypothetical protein
LGVRVGLGAADGDQDAGRLAHEVLDVEGRDLARPHRGGVPEEQDGPVADAFGVVGDDSGDDLAELGHGQRMSLPDRRDAHDPAQSSADPSYEEVGGGSANPSWRCRWAMPEQ